MVHISSFLTCVGLAIMVGGAGNGPLSFRTVGFYGIHLPVGDFAFLKFSYSGPADDKNIEPYNALLEEIAQAGQKAIVGLYTFDRITYSKPVEEYVRNTEALVDKLRRDLICAFCLGEENVTWNNGLAILNALYETVKRRTDLPCYQWLTVPDPPHPKLAADGWIFDAYGYRREEFRRHLAKFVVTGLPVMACVNATSPKTAWAAESTLVGEPGSPAEEQMRICREFNVPVFFYAVGNHWGNVHEWFRDDEETTARSRQWALEWISRAHAEPAGTLPLPAAEYLASRPLEVCGGADNSFQVRSAFDDVSFLDHAGVEGLRNLRWDGREEKLFVEGEGAAGRAVLYWHLTSPFDMEALRAEVSGAAGKNARIAVGLCPTLVHWHGQAVQAEAEEAGFTASASLPDDWHGRDAWLMLEMSLAPGGHIVLDTVEIRGRTRPPVDKTILLRPGLEAEVLYRDDFVSPKLLHIAEIDRPEELHWQPGGWHITGAEGGSNRVKVRVKFVADEPLLEGEVRIGAVAWTRDHAARIVASLSADGERPLVTRDTAKLPQDEQYARFSGVISLPLAEATELSKAQEFWLLLDFVNDSGVKAGPSATIRFLEVRGRSER